MKLEKDFSDFVELLNQHGIEYMVVGGYALAFHGEPRFTGDMDIWIDVSVSNAEKMVKVMHDFGAASLGFTKKDFMDEGIIKQIGQPPLRIDILSAIDGVNYEDAKKDKKFFKTGELKIPFIGVRDFIKNKEASGRRKDLQDIKKLKHKSTDAKKIKPKKNGKKR
jgi:hypothetical protein